MTDHGFEVDANKRCRAMTKKDRQCVLQALAGIDLCALHSGLARPVGAPDYGDARALAAYKRRIAASANAPRR